MNQTSNPTVTKSSVELYQIRFGDSSVGWADITIDAQGTMGRIQIASDYGNWQNFWGACGTDFKSFLGQINKDYAATKFGVEEWIDVAGTLRMYRELVIQYRRDGSLEEEEAREIYDEIALLEYASRTTLEREVDQTEHLSRFVYGMAGYPGYQYEPDAQFTHFWEKVWPVLLAEFAREKALIENPA
jgi:hypothetical protein